MTNETPPTETSHSKLPDTYLLIAAVGVFIFLLSLVIPAGTFETVSAPGDSGRMIIDPASFQLAEKSPRPTLFSRDPEQVGLFNAVFEGLTNGSRTGGAVGIMAFILLVGGAFGIVLATGSVERALQRVLSGKVQDGRVLLAGLFIAFSLGGAIFGMSEEVIPFVLMIVPVMYRLGYDAITGVLATYAATQIGFATSWMNPFNVAVAQGIAELPLLSGMPLRLIIWTLCTAFGIAFTLRYARQIKQAAGGALVPPEMANANTENPDGQTEQMVSPGMQTPQAGGPLPPADRLSRGDLGVLCALALTIGWIIWGVVAAGYYLPEIATQFVVLGVVAGAIGCLARLNHMTPNSAMTAFREGAQALLPAALIVGFARGIVYLMGGDDPTTPSMLNTVLHTGGEMLGGLPAWLAAWLMFIGQSIFNFFVTSGSGQAALTMPLLAPLSDLLGVTRQVAVLAFQLGDGITNLIVPTSAALMGCLAAARVDWREWLRASAPLLLGLMVLGSVFVMTAVGIGYA